MDTALVQSGESQFLNDCLFHSVVGRFMEVLKGKSIRCKHLFCISEGK
jgi:hypothetical protein